MYVTKIPLLSNFGNLMQYTKRKSIKERKGIALEAPMEEKQSKEESKQKSY